MKKVIAIVVVIIAAILIFIGFGPINTILVKFGFRNNDFNYIMQTNVNKVVIQNNRDPGFRYIITDSSTIKQLYETLSHGSVRPKGSSLEPDYIFEIYTGDQVKKYDYVVGVNQSGEGNFWDGNQAFQVPKNLDETIINNLSSMKEPNDFNQIYYGSIMKVVDLTKQSYDKDNIKVGVNVLGDVECLRYLFSVDLQNFNKELQKAVPGAEIVQNGDFSKFGVVINVTNRGYSTNLFKTIITVNDKVNHIYQTYYVIGKYDFNKWSIEVSKPNQVPKDWSTVGSTTQT
ncbi:hypothetical protein [uncultured Clostridium sp.]|uniref:hypothetical protein n=1 Tax=uncultured Clostridium sp. TaxID=59620 RepID=UPI002627A390|nr:hypothetical protein [uncultured Clostridium sp.]